MAANMNVINNEVFEALASLEKEKGIPMSYLIEKISNAIAIAIKRLAAAKIPSLKLTQQRTVFM